MKHEHHCVSCEHGHEYTEQKVRDDIARVGWSDIGVFPAEDGTTRPFNYTVGLAELNHPDLIVIGMANEQSHLVLSAAVQVIQRGTRLEADTLSDEVLQGFNVAFLDVLDPLGNDYPMSMTHQLYGEVKALQLVWPDKFGRFPWHAKFDPVYREWQALLGIWGGADA